MTSEEAIRYSRQMILPGVGMAGQQRLKDASVLVVGVGGLGSPLALYLAAAGVGRIGLIDPDRVSLDNLHRQILYRTSGIDHLKVEDSAELLGQLNPNVEIERFPFALDKSREDVVSRYDIVADGTDNFATRYLINDLCVKLGKPNVHASVFQFQGQISVFDGARGPCYRCLFPTAPPAGQAPNCAEAGVLGVLPGILGTMQATEVLKLILGVGKPLIGRLLMLDALEASTRELKFAKNPHCPACGDGEPLPVEEPEACATGAIKMQLEIPIVIPKQLQEEMATDHPPVLVDVREDHELLISKLPFSFHIPMGEFGKRFGELDPEADIVVYCRSGNRSGYAAAHLMRMGFKKVRNLAGGINRWATEIDRSMPVY